MPRRAAIVTGASTGIGLAIARMLASEGHALTINSRRPEKIEAAVEELRGEGFEVQGVPGSVADEVVVQRIVGSHRDAFGRLDVLVNNAGVGAGQAISDLSTKLLDLQLGANLRHIPIFYREALDLLRAAGAEHRNAHVINVASISGKRGEAWLSVYSATKHGVVGFTEAMNKELGKDGIKSCALCPGLVDTSMTEFLDLGLPPDQLINTADIAEMVRAVLNMSPGCTIPEIIFEQTGSELAHGLPARS